MASSNPPPLPYVWRENDQNEHTLLLNDCPILTVAAQGAGWRVRVVLKGEGIEALEYAVRSLERGKAWAHKWVKQRERLVAKACGHPVKPLPPFSSARGSRRKVA